MPIKLNNHVAHRVLVYILCAAISGLILFVTSRASDEDVKKNEAAIHNHVDKAEKRLRSVEDNVLLMCEFLDRRDQEAGGSGVKCRDSK